MARVAFVTTSFPGGPGDPSGHFVETEAFERAEQDNDVIVIAPLQGDARRRERESPCRGARRGPFWELRARPARGSTIRIEWLPGGAAFGFPGVLARVREQPTRVAGAFGFVAAARRALATLDPDAIIAHFLIPSAWPIACSSAASVDAVLHGSDVRLFERMPRAARARILRALVAQGTTFRCVSAELRDRFVRSAVPEVTPRVRVEASPMDLDGAPSRRDARGMLGVREGDRVAVIAARLVPGKRPAEAIRIAQAKKPNRIVVAGDGPLFEKLRRDFPAAEFLGLVPRNVALGWIAAADFVVSAAREEGAPTVVREARALGVPVIAAPAGDLRQWAASDSGIEIVDELCAAAVPP